MSQFLSRLTPEEASPPMTEGKPSRMPSERTLLLPTGTGKASRARAPDYRNTGRGLSRFLSRIDLNATPQESAYLSSRGGRAGRGGRGGRGRSGYLASYFEASNADAGMTGPSTGSQAESVRASGKDRLERNVLTYPARSRCPPQRSATARLATAIPAVQRNPTFRSHTARHGFTLVDGAVASEAASMVHNPSGPLPRAYSDLSHVPCSLLI